MKFKVGDLVDWPGTFPDKSVPAKPLFAGRIIDDDGVSFSVQWPENRSPLFHYKRGSAMHFKLRVLDDFETTGVE
jgi:hypothetical protein